MTLSSVSAQIWGSRPFSKAGVWLLQLKGSRTTVLPFQDRSSQPPKACGGGVQRAPAAPHTQGFGRKQAAGCLGATQLMERLCLQEFGCFSTLTPWSRAKGTESQRTSGLVCLLMFLPKTFTPSTAFTHCKLAAVKTCTQSQGQRDSGTSPRKPDPANRRAPLCTTHHPPSYHLLSPETS